MGQFAEHLLPAFNQYLDYHRFKDDLEVDTDVTRRMITHDADVCHQGLEAIVPRQDKYVNHDSLCGEVVEKQSSYFWTILVGTENKEPKT